MTIGSTATVSLTTAFIDLSTYDEIECWLYGGKSVNKFRKVIRKSAWFTVIAAQLNRCGTTGDFGIEMQAMFSRAGDYIRDVWLRVELPEVKCKPGSQARWTRNIGHNLIEEAYLHFNDLMVNKLTSYHMDFLAAFMTPAGKVNGYENMIGNIPKLVNPYYEYHETGALLAPDADDGVPSGRSLVLPRTVLHIPLPFYFTHEPSDAIIQAACPFNDVRLIIKFRQWEDLLIIDKVNTQIPDGQPATVTPAEISQQGQQHTALDLSSGPLSLKNPQVWAHYAVIPNGDREKIGEENEIDTVITQVQTIPPTSLNPTTQDRRGIDLRFAHSIRAIFFAMRNTTIRSEWSNYSTHTTRGVGTNGTNHQITFTVGVASPIALAILTYENVDRVNMSSDYFTMVAPWYSAVRIPEDTGYHMISYANRLDSVQPDGSTTFARLASVNRNIEASEVVKNQAAPAKTDVEVYDSQYHTIPARFDIIITASSISILRYSSGSVGFPVL